ncbi:MAG: hypothetical protein P1P81_00240 [Desulfobulbales bacterium]|nr:hypothetical protein [Desulfobulbales bacterium]
MGSKKTVNKWFRPALFSGLILLTPLMAFSGGLDDLQARLSDEYRTDLIGFIETRAGVRLRDDPSQKDASLGEVRLQMDLNSDLDFGILKLKTDLLGDLVTEEAIVELRELNLLFFPHDMIDVKAGRQVLTWGTGDLLFINDLFPKDWESFFIGRDVEYLKAPSDALKSSVFTDLFNFDLIYVPRFNGSEYIDGSRISYWNGVLGRTSGRDFIFVDDERNKAFEEDEVHARLNKNLGGLELDGYGYYGYWKTPEGVKLAGPKLFYPGLAVIGASARNSIWGGIGNLEIGYYDSFDDRKGADPLIRNSEIRFLAGFVRELARNFTGGFQYYLEYMQDYDEYESTADPATAKDEYRHVTTVRLTRLLMNQTLTLSLFAYYSPSDEDGYLRPKFHYKVTDQLAVDGGINWFFGADDHTFFGQFEEATNIYVGVRWNY